MLSSVQSTFESVPPWAKYGLAGLAVAVPALAYMMRGSRKSPYKVDWKKGTVYLYQFPRSPCIPSISPFCLKLETWLRMADVNYEVVLEIF